MNDLQRQAKEAADALSGRMFDAEIAQRHRTTTSSNYLHDLSSAVALLLRIERGELVEAVRFGVREDA